MNERQTERKRQTDKWTEIETEREKERERKRERERERDFHINPIKSLHVYLEQYVELVCRMSQVPLHHRLRLYEGSWINQTAVLL